MIVSDDPNLISIQPTNDRIIFLSPTEYDAFKDEYENALNEIDCRGKTFLKKKVFDIKAKAYELDGRRELEHECRNYAGVLAELIKSCSSERKRPVSVAMFNYF